jgi:hypothetical protein
MGGSNANQKPRLGLESATTWRKIDYEMTKYLGNMKGECGDPFYADQERLATVYPGKYYVYITNRVSRAQTPWTYKSGSGELISGFI